MRDGEKGSDCATHGALSQGIDAHVWESRGNDSFSFCITIQGACVQHNLNNTSKAVTAFKLKVGFYNIMK